MPSLRIGLAQCRQTADFDANAATILRMMNDAARQRVQILCFPETQTVGYRVDIATPDRPVPVERLDELHGRVAARCAALGMACVLGTETPLESDPRRGKPYNSALVISEAGAILGVHHKTKLTPLDAVAYSPGRALRDVRPVRRPGRRGHLLRGASASRRRRASASARGRSSSSTRRTTRPGRTTGRCRSTTP